MAPSETSVITTDLTDEERSKALLVALGLDAVSPAVRELALGIARRYDLDPMLKHLVLIKGKPYITRDGLLHVAHKSGVFDGIEVTDPVIDEVRTDGARRYWRARATVYRKDMSRPFVYPGRYPINGDNVAYAEEMAIKVAEVMCLRRAFDVAAPVVEEKWELDADDDETESAAPTSLAERVAIRTASLTDGGDRADQPEITGGSASETSTPEPEPGTATPEEQAFGVSPAEVLAETAAPDEPEPEPEPEPIVYPTLDEFALLVADIDPDVVKRTAKSMYPEITKFADLTGVELANLAAVLTPVGEPPIVEPTTTGEIVLCGNPSPYSDAVCTQDAGHDTPAPGRGVTPHRAGIRESW
jgi:hypothetical protein